MISIIIPVYNQANKLGDCLDSIINQKTTEPLEVVVIDDGSSDKVADVFAVYAKKFSQAGLSFKSNHQANSGAPAARNSGFRISTGEYLLFCDADAVLKEDALTQLKTALDQHPEASYAYPSFIWGRKNFRLWPFDAEKLKKMPYIHTTALIRRGDFPGFDESIKKFQDWDLWLTMLKSGRTGVWVDNFAFRIRTGGTMSDWLPAFAYKLLPWLPAVKKYQHAMAIIKQKHQL